MLRGVVWEIDRLLTNGKVEKITQPAKEEINITFRRYGETLRLCIRGGANMPRLSLTRESKESPATPPMFCMLLRKHLGGATLLRATQAGYERVARLTFSGYDEMGYPTEKHLVVELMGKYSNLLLLDGQDKILAVLRAVDFTTSRVRQVLSGMIYELPPAQDKVPPLEETRAHFAASYTTADAEQLCERWLTDTYLGTSRQVARQIVYLATGKIDARMGETNADILWQVFDTWFGRVRAHEYTPSLAVGHDGKPLDDSYGEITYFGDAATVSTYPTFCDLLDACYATREKTDRIRQRASDLYGIVERVTARLSRKSEAQEEELQAASQGEKWQRMGDLLTANLWRVKRGDPVLKTEDFYEQEPCEVEIPLDTRLSPAQNAQRYYKLYTKAKHARLTLTQQIEKGREELRYLDSVRTFLDRAETEADLNELREELYRAGYASRMKGYASQKQIKLRPMEFTSPGGYRVLVGRNNMQNDQLTFRVADRGDLWFHAKGFPGSHVILVCHGEEPPAEDYTFAATLAAKYSRAAGDAVAVDYTRVRYVKKPPASKPGYVTYQTNFTAYVSTSDEAGSTAEEK
jgi:predicted ribosome quality control (RQC) complex YloA/Tae2 family protein